MTWVCPPLKIAAPKDALTHGLPPVPEGMMAWRNRKNKYVVLVCGYYADPHARTEAWWGSATEGLQQHEIDSEYLCSFASRGGMKVLPWLSDRADKFTRSSRNYRNGSTWLIPNNWHLIAGLDYGGSNNPTSFHIYAIDENKLWHSIWEYYKPSHYREISEAILSHPLYTRLIKIVVDPTVYKRDQHVEGRVGAFTSIGELLGDAGVHILENANHDRAPGLARVLDQFNQRPGEDRPTRIVFSDDCPEQFRELSTIIYKPESQIQLVNRNPSEDVAKKDDHCFVAGTLIKTESGYKPIESIPVGEMVLTRGGVRPVIKSWQTGIKDTLRLYFSNGSVIVCTANHPIYTENRGFIRADELKESDTCVIDETWSRKRFYLTALFFADIRSRSTQVCEIILLTVRQSATELKGTFIARYGSFIAEKFLQATTFITETGIRLITTSQTLSVCPEMNTIWSTQTPTAPEAWPRKKVGSWIRRESLLRFGTPPKKEERGTASTAQAFGMTGPQLTRSATLVAGRLRLLISRLGTQGSAPITAGPPHAAIPALTISKYIARNVIRNLKRAVTGKARCAEDSVAQLLRIESGPRAVPVYNLSVEGYHEYYAQGVLVSNSYDDLRYALMAWDSEAEYDVRVSDNPMALDNIERQMDEDWNEDLEDLFN